MSHLPEVAGALFYERLLAKNPGFRPLFNNNMRIQGVKLMSCSLWSSTICLSRAVFCLLSVI